MGVKVCESGHKNKPPASTARKKSRRVYADSGPRCRKAGGLGDHGADTAVFYKRRSQDIGRFVNDSKILQYNTPPHELLPSRQSAKKM
jgi:hypothetical protein